MAGPEDAPFKHEVLTLHKLAQVLRKDRMANGALEIGGNEVKFKLDEKGRPIGVYEKVMGSANWLIEEFMLLANKRVAAWVGTQKKGGVPSVRVPHPRHAGPGEGGAAALAGEELRAHAHGDRRRGPAARDQPLAAVDQGQGGGEHHQADHDPQMAKAIYSTENIGHYGLGFEHYTHFTSPIRRYPDLLVHRAMAHYLAGGKPPGQGDAGD